MPATPARINLLKIDEFGSSPTGRLIAWAVTYGRYIMIGTELVVLLAFISRFSLDRKLTDLKDAISQKQAILEVNKDLEVNIRNLQNNLREITALTRGQNAATTLLSFMETALPPGTHLESWSFNSDTMDARVVAGSTESLAQLLANLTTSAYLSNIEIRNITKSPLVGIALDFSANVSTQKKPSQGKR